MELLDWMLHLCFNFLRNCQIVLQGGCTILHSPQQCTRVPGSPYPYRYFLLFVFYVVAIIVGVKWCLITALIYNFLMVNDVKHLFMCLFMYLLWWITYSDILPILKWGYFSSHYWVIIWIHYGLWCNLFIRYCKYFLSLVFIFLTLYLEVWQFFILLMSINPSFSLMNCAFAVVTKNSLHKPRT